MSWKSRNKSVCILFTQNPKQSPPKKHTNFKIFQVLFTKSIVQKSKGKLVLIFPIFTHSTIFNFPYVTTRHNTSLLSSFFFPFHWKKKKETIKEKWNEIKTEKVKKKDEKTKWIKKEKIKLKFENNQESEEKTIEKISGVWIIFPNPTDRLWVLCVNKAEKPFCFIRFYGAIWQWWEEIYFRSIKSLYTLWLLVSEKFIRHLWPRSRR